MSNYNMPSQIKLPRRLNSFKESSTIFTSMGLLPTGTYQVFEYLENYPNVDIGYIQI